MKHYNDTVKKILERLGYGFVKLCEQHVYYITPKNQLVRFEDSDLICFELFAKSQD